MRISDWSSDVCSSDLRVVRGFGCCGGQRDYPGLLSDYDMPDIQAVSGTLIWIVAMPPLGLRMNVAVLRLTVGRSEEGREGKECVSTCRSRWSPYPKKQKSFANHTRL